MKSLVLRLPSATPPALVRDRRRRGARSSRARRLRTDCLRRAGPSTFPPGVLSGEAGRAAYDTIVRAVDDARHGRVEAIATAPVNKEAFRLAGLPWSGHTDLLAHLTGAPHVAMMFHSAALRVVLATVHIALAEVPHALTQPSLEATST